MKIAIVMGNRPHFIKSAPLIRAFQMHSDAELFLIHSGQHYDATLSDAFLKDFRFPPIDMNLAVGSLPAAAQIGLILQRIDPVLESERFDRLICMGDTNTTLAAALAAYERRIPCAHIEAGMRENIWRPEEINKKMADHCSEYLFAPIPRAVDNLVGEGIPRERIHLTGDITLDTFTLNRDTAVRHIEDIRRRFPGIPDQFDLLTMHRAETIGHRQILDRLTDALVGWPMPIVFPVHPHTARRLADFDLDRKIRNTSQISCLPALPYLDFLALLLASQCVLTDSSGVLKEAYFAEKPCLVVDDTTEYHEIFERGCAVMGGREPDRLVTLREELRESAYPHRMVNVFGDGHAAERMVEILTR